MDIQPTPLELAVPRIAREEGRRLFGADIDAYDRGRPGHPPRVYELLVQRCGLVTGARVVEIGPGTGQVTRRLLELGAEIVAVEPDDRLADHIRSVGPVTVLNQPLEDVVLPPESFDLAVAASSFHWVEERPGLAKLAAALAPGGWLALWWSHSGAEEDPSPFHRTLRPIVDELLATRGVELEESPATSQGGTRHGLHVEARREALARAGFELIEHELIPWSHTWDSAGIRALFASFSPIIRLDEATRADVLDTVEAVAERDFGGSVELPVLTSLYTARRPT
jgi:SAM-dependent methyltransferase